MKNKLLQDFAAFLALCLLLSCSKTTGSRAKPFPTLPSLFMQAGR